jgi:hypothetical protein
VIALDAVDGYVARRRGETSSFGSVFDIAADRVVDNVLWIVFAGVELFSVWVAGVFVARGFRVDTMRTPALALCLLRALPVLAELLGPELAAARAGWRALVQARSAPTASADLAARGGFRDGRASAVPAPASSRSSANDLSTSSTKS